MATTATSATGQNPYDAYQNIPDSSNTSPSSASNLTDQINNQTDSNPNIPDSPDISKPKGKQKEGDYDFKSDKAAILASDIYKKWQADTKSQTEHGPKEFEDFCNENKELLTLFNEFRVSLIGHPVIEKGDSKKTMKSPIETFIENGRIGIRYQIISDSRIGIITLTNHGSEFVSMSEFYKKDPNRSWDSVGTSGKKLEFLRTCFKLQDEDYQIPTKAERVQLKERVQLEEENNCPMTGAVVAAVGLVSAVVAARYFF